METSTLKHTETTINGTSSQQPFDEARMEAFMERMAGILNSGALALMISIGHRTRLFDTMASLPPATSGQIAEAAGLNRR